MTAEYSDLPAIFAGCMKFDFNSLLKSPAQLGAFLAVCKIIKDLEPEARTAAVNLALSGTEIPGFTLVRHETPGYVEVAALNQLLSNCPISRLPELLAQIAKVIGNVGGERYRELCATKTATARPIEIAPCALAWFQAYAATPGLQTTGPIAPWPESILRSRLRKIRYLAGYRGAGAHWTPGSLRDAFCSYHLAHFGSIDRLITESGHTDLRTTKDHYLGLVSPEAAAAFWNLYPHQEPKIIKLATA